MDEKMEFGGMTFPPVRWPSTRVAFLNIFHPISFALLAVTFQILIFVGSSRIGLHDLPFLCSRACRWDGEWYSSVVDDGYRYPGPRNFHDKETNLGFFPGYPLLVRAANKLTGWTTFEDEVLVSVLADVFFWGLLFHLMNQLGLSPPRRKLLSMAVFCYPGSFFWITGYSEALFILTALTLIWGISSNRPLHWWLGGVSGAVMSATRLVGVGIASGPLFLWLAFSRRRREQSALTALSLCLLSASGAGAFFAYCYYRFGDWGAYFRIQYYAWKVIPVFSRIYHPSAYALCTRDQSSGCLNQTMILPIALLVAAAGVSLLWCRRGKENDRTLLSALAFSAAVAFLIPFEAIGAPSMLRYGLAPFVFSLLVLLATVPNPGLKPRIVNLFLFPCFAGSLFVQCVLIQRFVATLWVA